MSALKNPAGCRPRQTAIEPNIIWIGRHDYRNRPGLIVALATEARRRAMYCILRKGICWVSKRIGVRCYFLSPQSSCRRGQRTALTITATARRPRWRDLLAGTQLIPMRRLKTSSHHSLRRLSLPAGCLLHRAVNDRGSSGKIQPHPHIQRTRHLPPRALLVAGLGRQP